MSEEENNQLSTGRNIINPEEENLDSVVERQSVEEEEGLETNDLGLFEYEDTTIDSLTEDDKIDESIFFGKLLATDPTEAIMEIEKEGFYDYGVTAREQARKELSNKILEDYDEMLRQQAEFNRLKEKARELKFTQNGNTTVTGFASVMEKINQQETSDLRKNKYRTLAKQQYFLQKANKFAEENEKEDTILSTVGEFADWFVSDTVNEVSSIVLDSGTDRNITLGEKVKEILLDHSLSPEEIDREFDNILKEVADKGLFTDFNKFIYQNSLPVLTDLGEEGTDTEDALWWKNFEIITFGAGALARPVTGVIKGGSLATKSANKTGEGADALIASKKTSEKLVKYGDEASSQEYIEQTIKREGRDLETVGPSYYNIGEWNVERYTAPNQKVMRKLELENKALDFVKSLNLGKVLKPEQFEKVKIDVVEELSKREDKFDNKNILNYGVSIDPDGRVFGNLLVGTSKGSLYKTLEKAEKYASKVQGEVVKTKIAGKDGFAVKILKNVDQSKYASAMDLDKVKNNWLAETFGSSTTKLTRTYDTILKMGESAGGAVVGTLNKDLKKSLKKMNKTEKYELDLFLKQADENIDRDLKGRPVTETEIRDEFHNLMEKEITQSQLEAFKKMQEIQFVDYLAAAAPKVDSAIRNGEEVLIFGKDSYRVKEVKNISNLTKVGEDGKPIYKDGYTVVDSKTGKELNVDELLNRDGRVYDIFNAAYETADKRKYRYVFTDNPKTRAVMPSDVLGYNYTMPRIYKEKYRYFGKQKKTVTLGNGKVVETNPFTFIALRSGKEARQFKEEFNNIVKEITKRFEGSELINLSKSDFLKTLKALSGDEVLESTIKKNSNWFDDLEDLEGLIKASEDYGFDLREFVDFARDGEGLISEVNDIGANSISKDFIGSGEDISETFFKKMQSTGSKKQKVLLGFGGREAERIDPTQALVRRLDSNIYNKSKMNFVQRAGNDLLKTIKEDNTLILNKPDFSAGGLTDILKSINFKNNPTAKKAEFMRDEIIRIAGRKEKDFLNYEARMDRFAESLYDKGLTRTARMAERFSGDPYSFVRGISFDMRLGFFALDQFMVQSSQLLNVMAVGSATLGTTGVVKSMSSFLPVASALAAKNPETVRRIAKTQASVLGRSEEEFINLVDYIKSTGRIVVDQNVLEGSGDFARAIGTIDKVREKGRIFFNMGEASARLGSLIIAHDEKVRLLAKSGRKMDYTDQNILEEIFDRQDLLTARMTRASASRIQEGFSSIPFQFLTYNFRMLEQFASGGFKGQEAARAAGQLSGSEKVRLAGAMTLFYGTAGVPTLGLATHLTNRFLSENETPQVLKDMGLEDKEIYTIMKGGAVDYFLSKMLNVDANLSSRLGIDKGMYDLWIKMVVDQNFTEIAFGPSGQLVSDTLTSIAGMLSKAVDPNVDVSKDDLLKAFRNFSSFDKAYKAIAIGVLTGNYESKNRGILASGLTKADAIATFAGIPLQEANLSWAAKGQSDRIRRYEAKIRSVARPLLVRYHELLDKRDFAEAEEVMKEVVAVIQFLPAEKRERFMRDRYDVLEPFSERILNNISKDLTTESGGNSIMLEVYKNNIEESKRRGIE